VARLQARTRNSRHLAVTVALCAALALAGCGRKGPLEPPPGSPAAQAEAERQAQQPQGLGAGLALPRTAEQNVAPPQEAAAPARQNDDRRFPLDFMLN